MGSPLVSIILPTYNRAEWLPHSIESVLNQTFNDWELIIWDDGSQDETKKLVSSYKDPRIRYYYAQNAGQSFAVNQAFRLANGKYIAFLDDDDRWYPEKLSVQVTAMEEHPEIDLLFSDFNNIDLTFKQKKGSYFQLHSKVISKLKSTELSPDVYLITSGIPECLLVHNFVLPSSTIIKRSCYEIIGGFNEQLRNSQDLEYWWRLGLIRVKFAFIDNMLLERVKPPRSLSGYYAIAYLNHIKGLDFCYHEALDQHRGDLIPFFKKAYQDAWQELVKIYAFDGERKKAFSAFVKSIGYSLSWRSIYLVVGAFLGKNFINFARKQNF